jgi:hypothetical protein
MNADWQLIGLVVTTGANLAISIWMAITLSPPNQAFKTIIVVQILSYYL